MKKLVTAFTLTLGLFFSVSAFGQDEIKLNIDGKSIECDVPPQIVEGRTMVPIRAIFENVGANVNWEESTKTITGKKGNIEVKMVMNSNTASVNGINVEMDCRPIVIDGRGFAPGRYVAEAFGCDVEWDGANKTVNIKTPSKIKPNVQKEETTAQTTKEAVTETTTLETTTHPMYNYDTYYKAGKYTVNKDIPAGEYVVFANPEASGYLYKYAKDGNVGTDGKRYIYSKYFDYNEIIKLNDGQFLDLSNSYAIPSADAKLETGHNGTYKAGSSINTGRLTFKLSPKSMIGFVDVGYPDANTGDRTIIYLTPDHDSEIINVTKDMYVRLYGCDVLNETLSTVFTYEPYTKNNKNTDSNLKFSDITPAVKKTVDDFLTSLASDMTPKSLKGTKYTSTFYNTTVYEWSHIAKNNADKKYIEIAKSMYMNIKNYASSTNGDIAYAGLIKMNGKEITGVEYRNIMEAEKKTIANFVNEFKKASNFETIEVINRNLTAYRIDTIRLNGTKVG